jgi:hypothetical protein
MRNIPIQSSFGKAYESTMYCFLKEQIKSKTSFETHAKCPFHSRIKRTFLSEAFLFPQSIIITHPTAIAA